MSDKTKPQLTVDEIFAAHRAAQGQAALESEAKAKAETEALARLTEQLLTVVKPTIEGLAQQLRRQSCETSILLKGRGTGTEESLSYPRVELEVKFDGGTGHRLTLSVSCHPDSSARHQIKMKGSTRASIASFRDHDTTFTDPVAADEITQWVLANVQEALRAGAVRAQRR